jgi:hypothetical protein
MASQAWKGFERRVCRLFGAERRGQVGPGGYATGSDDDGSGPFAIECKRTTRYQLRSAWIEQARRNAKAERRPWLLVLGQHYDRRPIAVLDARLLASICREAGLIESTEDPFRRLDRLHGAIGEENAIDVDVHVEEIAQTLENQGL